MTYMCNGLWGSNNFGIMYNDNVYKSMTHDYLLDNYNTNFIRTSVAPKAPPCSSYDTGRIAPSFVKNYK